MARITGLAESLTASRDRFRAAGISDWGMLAATGEAGPLEAALCGGADWDGPGPRRHDALSPVSHASRVRTPVLILHGREHTNVPGSQAEHFHRALRHFGVRHEYVVHPREGHAIRERAHRIDALTRTRASVPPVRGGRRGRRGGRGRPGRPGRPGGSRGGGPCPSPVGHPAG